LGHICQLFDLNADRYFGEPQAQLMSLRAETKERIQMQPGILLPLENMDGTPNR
jgi:hypothetical protein